MRLSKKTLFTIIIIVITFISAFVYLLMSNKAKVIIEQEDDLLVFYPQYYLGPENDLIITIILNNDKKREIWKTLPLSNNFLKKYKNKMVNQDRTISEFILPHNIYYQRKDLKENEYEIIGISQSGEIYLLIYKLYISGKVTTHETDDIELSQKRLIEEMALKIDDIELLEKKLIIDSDGRQTKDTLRKIDINNYIDILPAIIFPKRTNEKEIKLYGHPVHTRHNVALSEHFIDKYGYDNDIITFNTPYNYYVDYNIGSEDIRKLKINVSLDYEAKYKTYEFEILYDNDGFVDDIVYSLVKEIKLEVKYKYDAQIISILVVKNSDWDGCPLSDKFLSKYNSKDSILPDHDIVGFETIDLNPNCTSVLSNKNILRLNEKNGNSIIGIFKTIRNLDYEIDDILTYIVPEEKINLPYEEMYNLAFNNVGQ